MSTGFAAPSAAVRNWEAASRRAKRHAPAWIVAHERLRAVELSPAVKGGLRIVCLSV
jgi:hypothetical protein